MANNQRESDFINVLIWLETASEAQIGGALALAQGQVRSDIVNGLRSIIETDRPGLATTFPAYVKGRVGLTQLSASHHELASALRELAQAVVANDRQVDKTPVGYWRVIRELRLLLESGQINAAQHYLLADELCHRVNVSRDLDEWAAGLSSKKPRTPGIKET